MRKDSNPAATDAGLSRRARLAFFLRRGGSGAPRRRGLRLRPGPIIHCCNILPRLDPPVTADSTREVADNRGLSDYNRGYGCGQILTPLRPPVAGIFTSFNTESPLKLPLLPQTKHTICHGVSRDTERSRGSFFLLGTQKKTRGSWCFFFHSKEPKKNTACAAPFLPLRKAGRKEKGTELSVPFGKNL